MVRTRRLRRRHPGPWGKVRDSADDARRVGKGTEGLESKSPEAMNPEVAQLLAIIEQAYNKPSWHGANLRGSVRRVTAAQASWRASAGRHNIWEIVVHAAYWKYAVARRFTGDARGWFPLKGSNWFRRPPPEAAGGSSATAWKADLDLLDHMHASLRDVLLGVRPRGYRRR